MAVFNNIAFIGIGSNRGSREKACRDAIDAFASWSRGAVLQISSLYESEPWGYEEQERFINCVIKIETREDAFGILSFMQEVEKRLGKQKEFRWGPRTIDLDLLFFNQDIIDEAFLQIPHPLLHERRFVLAPLAELDPFWIHPVFRKPVSHLLENVPDQKKVFRITERTH